MILPRKFGRISDKYGREKTIIIGLFMNAILQIQIPFGNNIVFYLKGGLLIVMVGVICYIYIKKRDYFNIENINTPIYNPQHREGY